MQFYRPCANAQRRNKIRQKKEKWYLNIRMKNKMEQTGFSRSETRNAKTVAKLNNERTSIETSYPTDVTGPS